MMYDNIFVSFDLVKNLACHDGPQKFGQLYSTNHEVGPRKNEKASQSCSFQEL